MEVKIIGKEIRKLAGKKLSHYSVTQGACSDGTYVYMVFERKKTSKYSHRCKIVKLDLENFKIIKVSGALKIGHGNDIAFLKNKLYITHSEGSKTIHIVDSKTLKQLKGKKVKVPKKFKGISAFNAIAPYGKDKLILRVMGSKKLAIIDSSFKIKKVFKTETSYTTSQGMETLKLTVIRAYSKLQSGKNYLVTYNLKGKELSRKKIPIKGEMESVFRIENQLYVTTYVRSGKKREAYIGKIS